MACVLVSGKQACVALVVPKLAWLVAQAAQVAARPSCWPERPGLVGHLVSKMACALASSKQACVALVVPKLGSHYESCVGPNGHADLFSNRFI